MTDHNENDATAPGHDRKLEAMVAIARTILQYTELDDILAAITRELAQVIAFDRSSVAFMAPDGKALTLQHIYKGDATAEKIGEGRRIPLNDKTIIGWVALNRRPVLRGDIVTDGRFLEVVKEEQLRSDMIVPLVAHGDVIGTINVGCYESGALCEDDLDLLVQCAEIASAAIEHAFLLQEAKDLNERHLALRRNARDIIMLVDRNTGGVIEVNRRACDALGYTEEELLDMTYFELFHDDDQFQAKRDFVNILAQQTRQLVDRRLIARDGTLLYVDISADLMHIHQDTFVQLVVHDISQRKYLEQQIITQNKNLQEANRKLTQVDRMKTEFLQNISHELRTPLSIIIAYTDSLRDETLSPESRDEFLDVVAENGQNLLRLINDLLDLSHLELSGEMLCTSVGHVHDIIRAVWPVLEVEARHKNIEMRFRPGLDIPAIHFDGRRIQQVLGCLLHNAVKFTGEGGIVDVVTERDGDEVRVRVRDTGEGIPKDQLEHVFDTFHQIDGSSTRRWGGLGIGLAMARHIIELHDGRIWVESDEGEGSTFTFVLPAGAGAESGDTGPLSLVPDDAVEDTTLI